MKRIQSAFADSSLHLKQYPTIANDPNFLYQGGPLIANISIYPIFYAGFAFEELSMDLYKQLVTSPYLTWLGPVYNTDGQTIGTGSVIGSASIKSDPGLPSTTVKDAALQTWILDYVKKNLPASQITQNLYVPFHYPPEYNVDADGTTNFCGYHDSINVTGIAGVDFISYAVMPDISAATGCGSVPQDAITQTISHEVAEAVTDPYRYVSGWFDVVTSGDTTEIADICQGSGTPFTFPNGKTYMLENLWDKNAQLCQIYPGSPNSLPAGTIVKDPTTVILPNGTSTSGSATSFVSRSTTSVSVSTGTGTTTSSRSSSASGNIKTLVSNGLTMMAFGWVLSALILA